MATINTSSVAAAPAKLNLMLRVVGRRPDGYHLLEMLNLCVDLYDAIELTLSDHGQDALTVTFSESLAPRINAEEQRAIASFAHNSMGKAVEAFRAEFGLPHTAQICAHKRIPSGAGLGGGSSDAAVVLRLLAEATRAQARHAQTEQRLRHLALKLGADLPFFLGGRAAWVSGVGEQLGVIPSHPLSGREVLLVVPPFGCATPAVYAALRSQRPTIESPAPLRQLAPERWTEGAALATEFIQMLGNDLEAPACAVAPELTGLLAALRAIPGVYAQLTGSGSVVFVLPCEAAVFSAESKAAVLEGAVSARCQILYQKLL